MAREIIDAKQWTRRLSRWERMTAAEREADQRSIELGVTDLRDEAVGIVKAAFGLDELGLEKLKERGGACPATIRHWDSGKTLSPRINTLRRTLRACGKDLGVVEA